MEQAANEIMTRIMSKFADTGSMRIAFDSVMGEGAYSKFAGELYDELRAKSGAAA